MPTTFYQKNLSLIKFWIETTLSTVIKIKPSHPLLIPIKIQQNNPQRRAYLKNRSY